MSTAALTLKNLHIPGSPLVLANIWDQKSLEAILSINEAPFSEGRTDHKPVKAIATASWAIAAMIGVNDEDLTREQNLEAIARIAPTCQKAGLPLTVDLQDGYGDQIGSTIREAIRLGAVGANIEDSIPAAGFGSGIDGSLYSQETQVSRLKAALSSAADVGCPEFVINARCDVFRLIPAFPDNDEAAMEEAISRGKAYLEAGATTVFYWGGNRGLRTEEIQKLVEALRGKVAVKLGGGQDALAVKELTAMGIARASVGPSLYLAKDEPMVRVAERILTLGGRLSR
jgi:2-methylisocitrate lyase-like PEP mutase family enzyme